MIRTAHVHAWPNPLASNSSVDLDVAGDVELHRDHMDPARGNRLELARVLGSTVRAASSNRNRDS